MQIAFVLNDEKLFHANPFCVNNSGVILTKSNHKAKNGVHCTPFYYCSLFSFSLIAASTNPLNNGCGLVGLDLNSGWKTAPI